VAGLVVVFMLTFVIPTFTKMFKDLGADLPIPTQVVVWLSDFVRGYILLIIAGVAGCVFALRAYYRTEKGRSTIDALLLKLPVIGTLIRKVAVARFTRTPDDTSVPSVLVVRAKQFFSTIWPKIGTLSVNRSQPSRP
jgi:type IV pilus assembly protein PilC